MRFHTALLLLATLSIAIAAIDQRENLVLRMKGYTVKTNHFDHTVHEKETDDLVHSSVDWVRRHVFHNEKATRSFYKSILSHKKDKIKDAIAKCTANAHHTKIDYFGWMAQKIATLKGSSPTASFAGRCFKTISVSFTQVNSDSIELDFVASGRSKNPLCHEYMLIAVGLEFHIQHIYRHGKHKLTLKHLDADHFNIIATTGLQIFGFCDELIYFLPNLLKTLKLFFGGMGLTKHVPLFKGQPPKWMEDANVDWIHEATGYQWKERKAGDVLLDLNESDVHDGDFLAITRFDGLDQFIEYVSGSHAGHSTVAMRINGELHVLESQHAWYWPTINIQRTPWKKWIENARTAGFHVSLLPLTAEARQQFDTKRALDWFYTVEGQPYGYHNFIYGALDTTYDNIPPLYDPDFMIMLFGIIDEVIPSASVSIWGEGMNKRLGTTGLNFSQQYQEAIRQNTTFFDLWKIPEQDGWEYSDGVSYVCSAFVVGLYKAGGLFGNMSIQATEQTPKDLYLLNIFDTNATLPSICTQTDPDLPYCQIMGRFRMEFPGWGTMAPYEHMSETCATLPPNYDRAAGC